MSFVFVSKDIIMYHIFTDIRKGLAVFHVCMFYNTDAVKYIQYIGLDFQY